MKVFYRLATDAVTKLCELDCVKSRDVQEPEHRSAPVLDLHNLVTTQCAKNVQHHCNLVLLDDLMELDRNAF